MAEDLDNKQDKPKKKKGLIKWIILAVLLLALGGGGFFAYKKFLAKPPADPAQAEQTQAEGQGKDGKEAKPAEGQVVSLPVFLVNLADPLGRRYLKLAMDVEAKAEIAKNEAKIKDALLLLLSSKTYQELSTLDAKIQLKQDIVQRLNLILGNGKVVQVYFTDMVIQ
ncbi:flagellar basal body-associated FliL family protein [Desulfovibrio aminophilus]|uniref:flagellar basal body-associated FliL family protein n=1 Tax=Desulfovibrio aminophilus TaxID=81425 RepID=UPI00042002AB|nr:flagellar basal body-associated FliL family protein [Desulfovibrio aminophilus]